MTTKPRLPSSPSSQTRKPPVAPPVYRPQPLAKVLQGKAATRSTPPQLAVTRPGAKIQKAVGKTPPSRTLNHQPNTIMRQQATVRATPNLPVATHAPRKTSATRFPIQCRVAQLAMEAPKAAAAAVAAVVPVVPPHKVVDDLYSKLMFAHSVVGRMKRGSKEVDSGILSKVDGANDEIGGMSEILSNFTFDWVTKYNSLTHSKDQREIMADLINQAEAIDLSQMHARAGYLYSLSQQKAVAEVVPTKSKRMSEAQSAAAREKSRYPHGPSYSMGKTIGAIIDLDTGAVFVATSGTVARELTAATRALLHGVHEVEKWPIDACAEVNAIDQHIRAGLKPVPGETHLYSYCYTWDYSKKKWTGRSACYNCRQWLARYK